MMNDEDGNMKAGSELQHARTTQARQIHQSSFIVHHSLRQHAFCIALICVAIIAMFWRVFFLGETLIDLKTLDNQLPWGYRAGPSDYPYNRRDLTDMYVTRDYFVVSAYRDGEFPLWNPYTMAGHPIYADGVTRTLSPFLLFYKFFDVPLGYSLARITELLLAAIFMYIFLIAIGVSARGALAGSLVFALSAHSMLHLTGLGWWGGLMWLPLIMLFVDRAIARQSYAQATLAGVFLAAQFFCGYMPNQIYYVSAVVLYYLYFAYIKRQEKSAISRQLALLAVTLAVGFALAATQWVPTLELLRLSNRRIVGSELSYIYLPPWYVTTLIFPNLFGAAYDTDALTLFTALGVSHDHILYMSIAALVPLGLAIYTIKSKPGRAGAFAVIAAFSLVVMMAAPLYVPLTRFIPILNVIRVAVRAGVLFLFAACALVAFGTDLLLEASKETIAKITRSARRVVVAALAFIIVCIAAAYLMRATGFAVETESRGWMAYARRAARVLSGQFLPPDLSLLIPIAFAICVATLLWMLSKNKMSRKQLFTCLIALIVIDLFWAGGQFNESFNRSGVYPQTEITNRLRELSGGRVLVAPSGLESNRRAAAQTEKIIAPPNTLLPYQIPVVAGKNQQFPGWYREYASLIEPQPNLSHVVFDKTSSPFFDLLNVRYVVTYQSSPQPEGCQLIGSAEGVSVYENRNSMPRAFFAKRIVEANGAEESLNLMRDESFDPHRDVVVEINLKSQISNLKSQISNPDLNATGSATVVEDRRNRVVIETSNESDGLLVLSDNYYPGWRALIDGATAEIIRANHTMRAVAVPSGRHVVSFVFMPATFTASAYISAAAAFVVLAALSFSFIKRRRTLSGEEPGHDLQQD